MESPRTAMDYAHVALIAGVVRAAKPMHVLELGFGTGLCTRAIQHAMLDNDQGYLHVVDNGRDGPINIMPGGEETSLELASEYDFLKSCPSERYDLIVSDADHSGTWFEEHFRVAREGANLFFHDVTNPDYPNLMGALEIAKQRGYPWQLFNKSTAPGERCERGLLWVQKKEKK